MSEGEAFDRILASLHEAALDDDHWSSASALIEEALGARGSSMMFGDGSSEEDIRIYFLWQFFRGQRHPELEREYYEVYYPLDERPPIIRHAPDSRLFHITDLLTEEELKTSATYNEILARTHARNGIHVRLDGPNGSRIVWGINDPVDGESWSSAQLDSIRRLLPHIRQTVRVHAALARAGALGGSFAQLLDTTGLGIVLRPAGASWRRTTAPGICCGAVTVCSTRTVSCAPAGRRTMPNSRGCWRGGCRPLGLKAPAAR